MRYCESNDALMKKILTQLEKHEMKEAVQEIDSFDGLKELIGNNFSCRCCCCCCCCCCLSKSRGGLLCRMLCKRVFYGKNAALLEYLILISFVWMYMLFVLETFQIISVSGVIFTSTIALSFIALLICILTAKNF